MKPILKYILLTIFMSAHSMSAQKMLTLDESKQLALQNNVLTKNSRLGIETASQIKKEAFTKYFPNISAGGITFTAQKNMMEISTEGGNLPVYDGNPASLAAVSQFAFMPASTMGIMKKGSIGMLNIMQPVFAGGRIYNGNKLASLGEEVSKFKYNLSRDEALLKTEEQYWQIVQLNEKIKTIIKYEELLVSLIGRVEDGYTWGMVTKNDVLKVKLKHSEALLNKSKLENGRKLALMAFCQFIGIKYDSTMILGGELQKIEAPQSCYVDNSEALQKRAEYSLLQKSIEAEELQTKIKLGEYLPQVSVGIAGVYMKFDENDGKTFGVASGIVQIPISNWWEASHSLAERTLREEMAQNDFKDKSELLMLQMEKAWQDLTDAYKQINLSRDAKVQAEENLKVNEDSFKNGLSNTSDLLEAQAMMQQANDQLTDALTKYKIKFSTYLTLTGR